MILFFYGQECPHCHKMMSIIEKLEKERGIKVEKYEIWHNEENEKKFEESNKDFCPGVPFFLNTDTGKSICGAVPEEEFIKFALP